MREHLYKGKDKETGEWVYGNYVKCDVETHDLIFGWEAVSGSRASRVEITKGTQCEYIGLLDCKGQKIFEGDLIQQQNYCGEEYTAIYKVVYDGCGFCLEMIKGNELAMAKAEGGLSSFGHYENNKLKKGEVVGNVHDNQKEMLCHIR